MNYLITRKVLQLIVVIAMFYTGLANYISWKDKNLALRSMSPFEHKNYYMDHDREIVEPKSANLHYITENGKRLIVVQIDVADSDRKLTLEWERRQW